MQGKSTKAKGLTLYIKMFTILLFSYTNMADLTSFETLFKTPALAFNQ